MEVRTAVILAAGLGSRLEDRTAYKPKGFLEIDGIPLIERSVRLLLKAGIERIMIGTGYIAEYYEDFAAKYPQIKCIRSDRYQTTGSMYTFYNMRNDLDEPLLLLESDLLYHPRGLTALLDHPDPDVILASGKTLSGDEVYIETDADDYLVNMSKNPSELNHLDAELVGITKLSSSTFRKMFDYYESVIETNPKLDYEYALVKVANDGYPIAVHKIEDYVWCEIDDEHHLNRALKEIWPRIRDDA